MSIVHRLVLSSILILSAGCRTSDPLAGTWKNDTCYGSDSMPEDVESCGLALTFTDALDISLDADWVSMPATAENPGCITRKSVTGQTWSTAPASDHDVLTVEGQGSATVERTDCVNAEDDMDETATSDIDIPSGDIDYQISDDVLTVLTGELAGTYAP